MAVYFDTGDLASTAEGGCAGCTVMYINRGREDEMASQVNCFCLASTLHCRDMTLSDRPFADGTLSQTWHGYGSIFRRLILTLTLKTNPIPNPNLA